MVKVVKGILSDNGHVKRNTIIQIIIATLAFILLMRIYPFSVVESHKSSKQQAFKTSELKRLSGDEFTNNDKKLQTVYFTGNHVYQIKLYMTAKVPEHVSSAQRVTFRVYDESFSCISSEDISLYKIAKKGYLIATPDIDVELGKAYYYEILVPENCETYIELPIASITELNQTENSVLYIDGIINYDMCLVADFDYSTPLSILGVMFAYIIIIAISVLLYVAIIYLIKRYDDSFSGYNDIIREKVKIICSILLVLFGIYVIIYSVILNKFGSPMLDRGVYLVAIIAGVLWLLGGMWLSPYYPKARREYTSILIWKNYIQTVSFGLLFYALCQYVNADRELYHQTNTRWMLIFLAIAFLMLLTGRTIFNKFSAAWLVIGWICSAIYCRGFKGVESDYILERLACGVVVAWGLLILNIIISINNQSIKDKITIASAKSYVLQNKGHTIYFGLWVLFAILMYKYRFEKVWVFTATLPFFALMFIKLTPPQKTRLLRNFTNGIILSFGLVTLFCFIHRPHHYWMLYRYGGIFHTVACTGMYLAIVFAAVLGKLYGRLKDRKNMFLRCYYEYLLIGCVIGYIILTMSRTAFLTITVCTISVSALAALTYKKGIRRILQEFGVLAVTVIVCFPIVFTSVRMIPAVINDPIRYDLEWQDEGFMVWTGDPIYSDKYMTIDRFFSVLFGRFKTESDGDEQMSEINIQEDILIAFAGNNLASMDKFYITDTEDEDNDNDEDDDAGDISNGRFEIFSEYIKAISFKGHPDTGLTSEDGEEYAHAHNSYLQVFYNFGIIAGVVFIALYIISLLKSINIVFTQGRKYSIYFVPFALIVAFGFISLTEWAFHPCIPAGFCFLLMQAVLIKG